MAMATARQEFSWDHTSYLAAIFANIFRDEKKKPTPFAPEDFHPFRTRPKRVLGTVGVEALRSIFIDQKSG